MARMSLEQRRALLLASAWQVCSTQSVQSATTRAICARAGTPQSAFHYCFHSRDELLREIVVSLLPNCIALQSPISIAKAPSNLYYTDH